MVEPLIQLERWLSSLPRSLPVLLLVSRLTTRLDSSTFPVDVSVRGLITFSGLG